MALNLLLSLIRSTLDLINQTKSLATPTCQILAFLLIVLVSMSAGFLVMRT
jgi:hypothetical protein